MSQLNSETLLGMMRQMAERDPLLKRGIPRDWVCVVHPTMQAALMQVYEPPPLGSEPSDKLSYMMGRQTWVIEDAPVDQIQYMPQFMMRVLYREWFRREAQHMLYWVAEKKESDSIVIETRFGNQRDFDVPPPVVGS